MSRQQSNLFEQFVSTENLYFGAQLALKKCKRSKERALFFTDFSRQMLLLQRSLIDGTYRFGPYTEKVVEDPKRRTIHKAPFCDRIVHQALTLVIEPLMESKLIHSTYACRTGKGTELALRDAQRAIQKSDYALKMDVSKYFRSIDHQVLLHKLYSIVPDVRLRVLLAELIASFEPGIPIGNLTSQIFANWFLNDLDHFVKRTLKIKYYFRYMDDLLLLGDTKKQMWTYARALEEFAIAEGLCFPASKTHVFPCTQGVPFLGYRLFQANRPRLHRRKLRRLSVCIQLARRKKFANIATTQVMAGWYGSARFGLVPKLRRDLGLPDEFMLVRLCTR